MRALLKSFVRFGIKPVLRYNLPIGFQRWWVDGLMAKQPAPRGTQILRQAMSGVPAVRVTVGEAAAGLAILFLHGGGYNIGSAASYSVITARIARAAGVRVHVPDYRLAPEHPHPAALEDAVAAYRWLSQQGFRRIAIAGDSAGGGLALATAITLRDAGDSTPAALALISPWTDLSAQGETIKTHAARDPSQSLSGQTRWARNYAGGLPLEHPLCSPLYADLRGLPPILVHVASEEILLSDSLRLQDRGRAAGVDIRVRQFEGLWHDFQLHAGVLAEANESLKELGQFLRDHLDDSAPQ